MTEKPDCATKNDDLTIKIHNVSKTGISNLKIKTLDGIINLGGIKSGEITCPYVITPFYNIPAYEIYILRTNGISKTIKTFSIDHIGDKILKTGDYVLTINIKQYYNNLKVDEFKIKAFKPSD